MSKLIRLFVAPIFKLWVKGVCGLENIPRKGGAVVILNHKSYFDFLCFMAISPREIRFLTAEKFYKSLFWRPIMEITKQIKVDRSSKDKSESINKAFETLSRGLLLGIFPEGTRSPSGDLQLAYSGAVEIAIKANVPIIPVGIIGTYSILPRHKKLPSFRKRCTINIGKPVYLNYLLERVHSKALYQHLTHSYLMHKVANLAKEKYIWGPEKELKFLDEIPCKKIVFIDVDNTIINGQSQLLFLRYCRKIKQINIFQYILLNMVFILYRLRLLPSSEIARKGAFKIMKGRRVNDYKRIINEFYLRVLKSKINSGAKEAIMHHQQANDEIVLLSAAWRELLKPLANELGVKHVVGSELQINGGLFTGSIKGIMPYGHNKVVIAQAFLNKYKFDIRNTVAYADHFSDKDLLFFVAKPVVINPDNKIKIIALKQGWEINYWDNESI